MKNFLQVCEPSRPGQMPDSVNSRKLLLPGLYSPKKIIQTLFCLAILVFASINNGFAQNTASRSSNETTNAASLTSAELTSVLQNCIALPSLQKYFPVQSESKLKQITIVQYPFAFPQEMNVSTDGNTINFIAHPDPKSNGYFMFRTIENSQDKVVVNFNYFYKAKDQSTKILTGLVELQKNRIYLEYH